MLTHEQAVERPQKKVALFRPFSSTGFKKQMSLEQSTEGWEAAKRQIIKAFIMKLQAGLGRVPVLLARLSGRKFLVNFQEFPKEISRQEKGKGRVTLLQLYFNSFWTVASETCQGKVWLHVGGWILGIGRLDI